MANSQNVAFSSVRSRKTSGGKGSTNKTPVSRLSKDIVLELPPPGAMRWGARAKAAVVAAIRGGVLTLDEACEQYALSTAEYLSWEAGFDALGLEGLELSGRQLRRRGLKYRDK
jgi:hypothetical protein